MLRSEIISVGTEILLGHLVDAHAPRLAAELPSLDIGVYWISQIGDNQGRLADAISRAWERSDLVPVPQPPPVPEHGR